MRDLLALFLHFLTTLARLLGPGGTRAVIAETLLIKHQLVVLNRSRRRAPNLTATDRIVMVLSLLKIPSAAEILALCRIGVTSVHACRPTTSARDSTNLAWDP